MSFSRMLIVATTVFLIDRASKFWVVEVMDLAHVGQINVWPPFLQFRMAWNKGINFGLMNLGDDGRWLLIGLSAIVIVFVFLWTRKAKGWMIPVATGAIIGGALGNVFDRVVYGAVADFLNMSCCGIENPFAFNIADAAIFGGAIVLILFADKASSDPS